MGPGRGLDEGVEEGEVRGAEEWDRGKAGGNCFLLRGIERLMGNPDKRGLARSSGTICA